MAREKTVAAELDTPDGIATGRIEGNKYVRLPWLLGGRWQDKHAFCCAYVSKQKRDIQPAMCLQTKKPQGRTYKKILHVTWVGGVKRATS
jgi:hypothetical protein